MSRIVCAAPVPLPEGDFYITEGQFYSRIRPDKLDEFFDVAIPEERTLAEVLLQDESAAVYHLDLENLGRLGDAVFVQPLLLGANYHKGHSEGKHKIIVQDVSARRGPWVLFRPSGSGEKTFYLQDMVSPGLAEPQFAGDVANPSKIRRRFLHLGDPQLIFRSFRDQGFTFVDKPMSKEHLRIVGYRKSRS